MLFSKTEFFTTPAFPVQNVKDPTGAGDTFLGGYAGHLHKTGDLSFENMKRAVIYGSVMASFNVEKFSTIGLEKLNTERIQNRYNEFVELSRFDNE